MAEKNEQDAQTAKKKKAEQERDFLLDEAKREKQKYDRNLLKRRFMPAVVLATIVLCLVLVVRLSAERYYNETQVRLGDALYQAVLATEHADGDKGRKEAKERLGNLIKTSNPTYRLIALAVLAGGDETRLSLDKEPNDHETNALQRSLRFANRNKDPEGVASFLQLASFYQAFARFESADSEERAAFEKALKKRSKRQSKGGTWSYSYRELEGLRLLQKGEEEKAKEIFLALSTDAGTPVGMRRRMKDLLSISGLAVKRDDVDASGKTQDFTPKEQNGKKAS